MKKILSFITVLVISMIVFNANVLAKTTMTNLQEAVEEELELFDTKEYRETYKEYIDLMKKADFSNYEESDDKVNVYIFRGSSCWHCLDAVSFFASQVKENGKYFNVKTYEVWANTENSKLMSAVAKALGEEDPQGAVPFLVVGNKAYGGFSADMGEQIINQVKELYNTNKEDRYDVANEVNMDDASANKSSDKKTSPVTVILIVLVLVGGIGLIYYVSKSN